MRIVVHGQQAFGKAVLEALLEAQGERGRRLCGAREAGREGRSAEGGGAGRQAAGLSAGDLPEARGVGRVQGAQARPAGDGLRDAVRAGGVPRTSRPTARSSITPRCCRPTAAPAPSTGRSSRARRRPGCRSSGPTTVSIPATCCCRRRRRSAPTDTLGTVYFDRLFPLGVDAMMESVDLVKAGKAPRIKQDEAKATYEGRCGPDNARIDWGKPWEQIDRLIRGCNPAPGAWTTLDGKQLKIFDAKPLPAKDPKGIGGKLGEIVAVDADGFTVVCADGRFKVTRVQPRRRQEDRGRRMGQDGQRDDRRHLRQGLTAAPAAEIANPDLQIVSSRVDPRLAGTTPRARSRESHAMAVKSDIEIAREAKMKPIAEVGKRIGIPDSALLNYGPYKAKVSFDFIDGAQKNKDGKLILVTAISADARRRGQDHDHGRSRRRPQPHRQEGHELPARALARALLRRQGRRGRRRLRPGGADGGHQPPLHRRLPRHHVGAQPAVGDARQPHLLGQRAGARRAPHRLAPRHGHERPRAARRSSTRWAAPPTAFRARTASTSRWPPR